jgi:hypothetical protein
MSANNKSTIGFVSKLGQDLEKAAMEPSSLDKCRDLVQALSEQSVSLPILEQTKIGVTLGKAVKALKRHKRTEGSDWIPVLTQAQGLVKQWKKTAEMEAQQRNKKQQTESQQPGPPRSVAEYRLRLVQHKKELYKDPPVLPPVNTVVESKTYPLPRCDKSTGELVFESDNAQIAKLLRDFRPNLTPEQVLRAGSFGGTYFRSITSSVTNQYYSGKSVLQHTVEPSWIHGLDVNTMLTSATYRNHINKFGVSCGGSLGMWESSGWISDADPYGWFQWYCRFYRGRRCSDDVRQIQRWLKCAGPKGRFRSQLCNKILAARARHDDASISPVIRQTLWHWGLEITQHALDKHAKRLGA